MRSISPEPRHRSFWDEVDIAEEELTSDDPLSAARFGADRILNAASDGSMIRRAIYVLHLEGITLHKEEARSVSLWAQDPELCLEVVQWGGIEALGRMLEVEAVREEALKGLMYLTEHLSPTFKPMLRPAMVQAWSLIQKYAPPDPRVLGLVRLLADFISDEGADLAPEVILKCVGWRLRCDEGSLQATEMDGLLDLLSERSLQETLSVMLRDWAAMLPEDRRNEVFSRERWGTILRILSSAKVGTCIYLMDLLAILHSSPAAMSLDSLEVLCGLLKAEESDTERYRIIGDGFIKLISMFEVEGGCRKEDKIDAVCSLMASERVADQRLALRAVRVILDRRLDEHRAYIRSNRSYLNALEGLRLSVDPYLRAESEILFTRMRRDLPFKSGDTSTFARAFEVLKMSCSDDYGWYKFTRSLAEGDTEGYDVRRYSEDYVYLSTPGPSGQGDHYMYLLNRKKAIHLARDWDFYRWGLGSRISTEHFRSCVDTVLVPLAPYVTEIDLSGNEDSEASEALAYLFSRPGLAFPNLRTVRCSEMNVRLGEVRSEASSEEKGEPRERFYWLEAMFECLAHTAVQLTELDLSKNPLHSWTKLRSQLSTLKTLSVLNLDGISLHAPIIDDLVASLEPTLEELPSYAAAIHADEPEVEYLVLSQLDYAIRAVSLPSLRSLSVRDCDLSWLDWGVILSFSSNILCIKEMRIRSRELGVWPEKTYVHALIQHEYWTRARSSEWVYGLMSLLFYAPRTQKRLGHMLRNTRVLSLDSTEVDSGLFSFLARFGPVSLRMLRLDCNDVSPRLYETLGQIVGHKITHLSISGYILPEKTLFAQLRQHMYAYLPPEQRVSCKIFEDPIFPGFKTDMLKKTVAHLPGSTDLLGFLYTAWLCQLAQGPKYLEFLLTYSEIKAEPEDQARAVLQSILMSFLSVCIKKNEDTKNLAWPYYFLSGPEIPFRISLWIEFSRVRPYTSWFGEFSESAKRKVQEVVECGVEDLVGLGRQSVVRLNEQVKKGIFEAVWGGQFMAPGYRLKKEGQVIYLIHDQRPEQGGRLIETPRGYRALGMPNTPQQRQEYHFSDCYVEDLELCVEAASDLLRHQAPSAIDCARMKLSSRSSAPLKVSSVLKRIQALLSRYGHDLPSVWSFRECALTSEDVDLARHPPEAFRLRSEPWRIHGLDLSYNRLEDPWAALSALGSGLYDLDLSHNRLSFLEKSCFKDFAEHATSLRILALRGASLRYEDCFSILTHLRHLYRLDLSDNDLRASRETAGFEAPKLSEPFELKDLVLEGTSVSTPLLDWLREAEHLEELDLSRHTETGACLEALSHGGFPALKGLLLWGNAGQVTKELWTQFHESPLGGQLERFETDDRQGLGLWHSKRWGIERVKYFEPSEPALAPEGLSSEARDGSQSGFWGEISCPIS